MALVVMASALGSSPRAQSTPVLSDVLARLATYLTAYEEEYASTIASEHYTQTVLTPRRSRTLDAEFGIVRLPGQSPWLGFRDVIRVDGQPIQDREGRL